MDHILDLADIAGAPDSAGWLFKASGRPGLVHTGKAIPLAEIEAQCRATRAADSLIFTDLRKLPKQATATKSSNVDPLGPFCSLAAPM